MIELTNIEQNTNRMESQECELIRQQPNKYC